MKKDCKKCLGTGMGAIRVENSKCPDCGGRGYKEISRSETCGTDHECDEDGEVDCDICGHCGEHSSFCSICGMNSCCNAHEQSA